MTYPEPENPDKDPGVILGQESLPKYNHPKIYPVDYKEWNRATTPFHAKPAFYIPVVAIIIFICAAIIIIKTNDEKKVGSPSTPYYDEAVLTFPDGTTEWRLSPETRHEWPKYLCLIDGQWHKCYPTFIESTPAK